MVSRVSHTTVNARDAYAQSQWWRQVLGYIDIPDDPSDPGDEECAICTPAQDHVILFIEVDGAPTGPTRTHFDLRPTDSSRDEEVARLLSLGATQVADRRTPEGLGWVVLADPEGNEFCVLRSDPERRAAGDL